MKDPKNRFSLNQLLSKYYLIKNYLLFNSTLLNILLPKNEQANDNISIFTKNSLIIKKNNFKLLN